MRSSQTSLFHQLPYFTKYKRTPLLAYYSYEKDLNRSNSYCFLVEIGAKYNNILSQVKRDAFILPKTHLHAVLCTLTLEHSRNTHAKKITPNTT